MSSSRTVARTTGVAIRAMLVLTLALGVGYTLVVTGIGQLLLPFQARPSAAGDGYDGAASSGSNLGPENPDLVAAIDERQAAIAEREGVSTDAVPADAVTASGSGLDPHISVAYALLQVPRVAAERDLPAQQVRDLVESRIQGRDLGFLGEERINVAELNLALDEQEG